MTGVSRGYFQAIIATLKSPRISPVSLFGKIPTRLLAIVLFGVLLPGVAQAQQIEVQGANSKIIVNNDVTPELASGGGDGTDFGNAPTGNNAPGGSYFMVNRSLSVNLNIISVTITGTNASDYTVLGSPGGSVIAANGGGGVTLALDIDFVPGAAGLRGPARVTIVSNDGFGNNVFSFDIQGTGILPPAEINVAGVSSGDVTPSVGENTDFGQKALNVSTDQTFSIENTGGVDLILNGSPTISIVGSSAFSVVTPPAPNTSIGGSSQLGITLRFTPTTAGVHNATVSIANSDTTGGEDPYTFAITGEGVVVTAPEIVVEGNNTDIVDGSSTPSLGDHTDFGSVNIASGLVSRTFTIRNTGTATLNITGVSLAGPGAPSFSVTTPPPSTLAANASTTFVVGFDPSTTGVKTAALTIQNSDSNEGVFDFAIQGAGTSAAQASITIVQKITGPDRNVSFTSATSALNFSLTTINGTAQSTAFLVAAGIHTITAADLSSAGYGISAIYCDDANSSGDANTRTATINLSVGETIICTFESVASRDISVSMIGDFLGARNTLLLTNQPDLVRRLNRFNPGAQVQNNIGVSAFGFAAQLPFPIDVNISQSLMSYAASSRAAMGVDDAAFPDINTWDIWSEGTVSLFDTNSGQRGNMGVVHAGVDYLLNKDTLVGLRAQVDWMNQDFAATSGTIKGTGWMVGPYTVIRLGQNFYFNASATWGTSINAISPVGTYTDEFTTSRWLVNGGLVGEFEIENWMIRPTLEFTYINAYQNAYTDSLNVSIPGQSVAQGEIRFGPRVSYSNEMQDGSVLIPWAEISGVYSFASTPANSASSLSAAMSGITGSFKSGVDLTTSQGALFSISGQYDGIGSSATNVGVTLGISAALD